MKCPKCGYNSFEYHDSCKKCSGDLGSYKRTYNITSIVLPPEAREKKGDEFHSASSKDELSVENVDTHDDIFPFDPPEHVTPPSSPAAAPQNDDPFNFDDQPEDLPASPPSPPALESQNGDPFDFDEDITEVAPQQSKIEDGGFADLLESTSQIGDDPFATLAAASPAPPAKAEAATSGASEFDLENFSWDETAAAVDTSEEQSGSDEFDSLFGATSDSDGK